MKRFLCIGTCLLSLFSLAQEQDATLLAVKHRMDSIVSYKADLSLEVSLEYLNMPTKHAQIIYHNNKPLELISDQFMMVPKKGLDFQLGHLLEHDYMTVDRGHIEHQGTSLKQLNIIPLDSKADFTIATIAIDTTLKRLVISEISTKKNGTYKLTLFYKDDKAILPNKIEVAFEVERLKIPIDYIAKEANVSKHELDKDSLKTGKILLNFSNYSIQYLK